MGTIVQPIPLPSVAFTSQGFVSRGVRSTPMPEGSTDALFSSLTYVVLGPAIMPIIGSGGGGSNGWIAFS